MTWLINSKGTVSQAAIELMQQIAEIEVTLFTCKLVNFRKNCPKRCFMNLEILLSCFTLILIKSSRTVSL